MDCRWHSACSAWNLTSILPDWWMFNMFKNRHKSIVCFNLQCPPPYLFSRPALRLKIDNNVAAAVCFAPASVPSTDLATWRLDSQAADQHHQWNDTFTNSRFATERWKTCMVCKCWTRVMWSSKYAESTIAGKATKDRSVSKGTESSQAAQCFIAFSEIRGHRIKRSQSLSPSLPLSLSLCVSLWHIMAWISELCPGGGPLKSLQVVPLAQRICVRSVGFWDLGQRDKVIVCCDGVSFHGTSTSWQVTRCLVHCDLSQTFNACPLSPAMSWGLDHAMNSAILPGLHGCSREAQHSPCHSVSEDPPSCRLGSCPLMNPFTVHGLPITHFDVHTA
jgi:hypothetical protein